MVQTRGEAIDEYLTRGPAKNQYRDTSTVVIMPTRAGGMVHWKVWRSWDQLHWPQSQWRALLDVEGQEVGEAYNNLVNQALNFNDSRPGGIRFILSREDDNLPDPNAVLRLYAAIYTCIDCGKEIDEARFREKGEWFCVDGHKGLDVVSGLYYVKGLPPIPLVMGDPAIDNINVTTREITDAIKEKKVLEVNAVAMGLCLYRTGIFKEIKEPWFKTLNGANGQYTLTQDIYFSKKARQADLRLAVDCGALVGHIDTSTGAIY